MTGRRLRCLWTIEYTIIPPGKTWTSNRTATVVTTSLQQAIALFRDRHGPQPVLHVVRKASRGWAEDDIIIDHNPGWAQDEEPDDELRVLRRPIEVTLDVDEGPA